jgi:hypothetical protein
MVLGMAGTGKTVLVDHLRKGLSLGYRPKGQSYKVEHERRALGDLRLRTVIVPGQPSGDRADTLHKWKNKTVHGVIHVMANGYRTRRDTTKLHEDLTKAGSIEAYVRAERDVEVTAFIQDFGFYEDLFRQHRTRWILIAVTKADLYWDKREEANAFYHYAQTTFGQAIHDLERRLGADNVTVAIIPVCATLEPLVLNGQELRPQFGDASRAGLLLEFQRVIQELGAAT